MWTDFVVLHHALTAVLFLNDIELSSLAMYADVEETLKTANIKLREHPKVLIHIE